jgi:predicted negative regulator of RcsB-dependent stress response
MEDEPEEAWGLRACFALNFVRVMLYHCLVMVGSLVFWIWWQYNHPGDFQNASIPFMATVTTIAVIWNSVATVNNFK